jgi:diguanylate cyclase (GGDEF)-like protein
LQQALQGHPGTGVEFSYHGGTSNVAFRAGTIATGSAAAVKDLNNGWTVRTYAVLGSPSVASNSAALGLLAAGIALSAALAALLLVLSTSRLRALRLVDEKTAELRHQALHDVLTDLPNRALVADRVHQLLLRSKRAGSQASALYLDLDGFKDVNDSLGHDIGDRLLQGVAERLRANLRDVDTIGRFGGDEFVVLVESEEGDEAPMLVAQRILEAVRQPFDLQGAPGPILTSVSIGIATGDRTSAPDVLRDADIALYQAKADGKNRYEMFRPEMDSGIHRRFQLEMELRGALEANQFHLVYQPIYDLGDLSMVGFEALLRWRHPKLGTITPDEFVPLLESSGHIVEVGRWVLDEACAQMARWRLRQADLTVAVNISSRQLDRDDIVDHVVAALKRSALDPSALTLEITETALMKNVDSTADRLTSLKSLGVKIAIDDFGTGYSSLAYIQRFPVDCLKIDRSFTESVGTSKETELLVHTLVQLGKNLGLRTVAEGIETLDQVDHLRGEHVDEAQGYLFARPLEPAVIEEQFLEPAYPSELA